MENTTGKFSSAFLDAPWIVAALLGVWGVMIGLEDFLLADIFFVAAGALVCVKVAKETNLREKERRLGIFVTAFICIMVLIGLDFRWTNRKATEASTRQEQLSHLGEIPKLNGDLQKMQNDRAADKITQALVQAKSDQKLDDIEGENKDLRKSVETKDAALVKIAKDQYALNFFPQIVVTTNGSTEQMFIQNLGKTNVVTYRLNVDGDDIREASALSTIAPNASNSFQVREVLKARIINRAVLLTDARVPLEGTVYLSTLDDRRYSMGFTWYFEIKDGKIDKSYIEDQSITEVVEGKPK
jgi:hypothetical protein